MQFNKQTAVTVLNILASFPAETMMRPAIHEHRPGILTEYILPHLCEGLSTEDVLAHLHILACSGLVHPETNLKDLQQLLAQSGTDNRDKYNNDGYSSVKDHHNKHKSDLWEIIMPNFLAKFYLTVQGYEWLEEHRGQN